MASTDLPTIKSYQQELQNLVGPSFTCIIALLIFVLADPLLSSVFVTFLQTLQAQIALQKTELQALVAQMTVMLGIINAEVGVLSALSRVADGLGNRFPIAALAGCLPQTWVQKIQGSDPTSSLNIPNPLNTAKRVVRDIQYNEAVLQTKITQINQSIAQLNLFQSQIQALINYFQALQNYAGKLPHLPL